MNLQRTIRMRTAGVKGNLGVTEGMPGSPREWDTVTLLPLDPPCKGGRDGTPAPMEKYVEVLPRCLLPPAPPLFSGLVLFAQQAAGLIRTSCGSSYSYTMRLVLFVHQARARLIRTADVRQLPVGLIRTSSGLSYSYIRRFVLFALRTFFLTFLAITIHVFVSSFP